MTNRADERMWWLLLKMVSKWGHIVAWDDDVVDEFVDEFPEARNTLIVFTLGHNVSPMLNRAAKRAKNLGYISASSIGNQDARSLNSRTWCRTWRLTIKGVDALLEKKAELREDREQYIRQHAVG